MTLACRNCGSPDLIKAHLIPRAFCVEVQEGTAHAAGATPGGDFEHSQSGIWDRTILCADCDAILGTYENYVFQLAKSIRQNAPMIPMQIGFVAQADPLKFLRFCAGILYKYSVTGKKSRIALGRYQDVLRNFIFDPYSEAPRELDAFILRPLRHVADTGVFVYRSPKLDRKEGRNLYRMMLGGLLIFVRLDQRLLANDHFRELLVKGRLDGLPYETVPAAMTEEFTIPARMMRENQRLSDYLDRIS